MPLRDYKCRKCGDVSEHLVKHDESNAPKRCDRPLVVAPLDVDEFCDGELERVNEIARTSFELKGSGWAADGYR